MVVTRQGFSVVVNNALSAFGFPPEAPTMIEFPLDMFLPGSDLSPLEENVDHVIDGLTKWTPQTSMRGTIIPRELIKVHGRDYEEAITNMNLLFLKNLWSDGLPIQPPTVKKVNWLLTGTDLPQDTALGKILPRGGIATPETIAVCLAMAGGRPEYMPVLIAAVQAMIDPILRHEAFNATTCSIYPVVIVNGPLSKQIRLNSGYGCLGPDPVHPAGAGIGRALRLILQNMGGAIPGMGTMSIHGGPARYANIVFAEDEDGLPPDWQPFNVSYWRYPRGTNTVTVHAVSSTTNVGGGGATMDGAEALSVLYRLAGFMAAPNSNYFSGGGYSTGSPGIILMARGTAQTQANFGWSKEKIKAFLWENSKIPVSVMQKVGFGDYLTLRYFDRLGISAEDLQDPFPITRNAQNIMIVVAGGEQSGHSYWMQVGMGPAGPASAEIKLPRNFDALLKKAEADLGPLPAR